MKRLSAFAFLMALPLVAPALDLESIYDQKLNGIPKVLGLKWLDQENLKLCETLAWDFYGISPEQCRKIVLEPVSYTHLDVYKRQALTLYAKEGILFILEFIEGI